MDTTAGRYPTAPTLLIRRAVLAGVGVFAPWRRLGLGRRLLTGILTLLRAEGLERVYASTGSVGAGASLLASAGFADDSDAAQAGGRSRYSLTLEHQAVRGQDR